MTKRTLGIGCLSVLLMGGMVAGVVAQDQPPAPGPERMQRGPGGGAGKFGQMGPGRGPGGPALVLRGLSLTDAQREQIRTINQSHREEFAQLRTRLRDAHRLLAQAAQANPVDEAGVRARASELATAIADEAILRGRVHNEVLGVLTPEQVQTLNERRAKMEAGREQMQQRMRERRR